MIKVNSEQFDDMLKSSPILIADFGSPGCAPCKKVPPLIQEILAELGNDQIVACEVNVAEAMDLAKRYLIMSVPTIIIFKAGQESVRFSSLPKKEKLLAAL